ncbi:toxin-antitoxin system YwqK family antitoxin [Chryseolinea lacunae]|uniref:Toxin-antitoxin system YwqK family antitoxin n=1 Tax=Chryseolinea lacunae TaxID=2801331 RepID=A0ABS1KKY6_9BACT|nr:hypothetical protein [Chryseolinea lacunae]MBL0740110.1 hypothetical protein [Chryseolinea lacunae]
MKNSLLIFLVPFWLYGCSNPAKSSTYVKYFSNGKVEFEVPVKDGVWDGLGIGYYPSGKKRGVVTYVNGKKEGVSFEYWEGGGVLEEGFYVDGHKVGEWNMYSSTKHILSEKIFYNDLGRVVDFHRYDRSGSGRRNADMFPITYIYDSATTEFRNTFFIKMGNADSLTYQKGIMIITSGFRDGKPVDTLSLIEGDNRDGFLYEFTPVKEGENSIVGKVILDVAGKPFPFEFIYDYQAK